MRIVVVRPGLLDTVQDLGRSGYRQLGIPEGGAADQDALIRANRLVGNADGEAGIEFTIQGPVLSFPQGGKVSLTGARFEVNCSGRAVNWDETLVLAPGGKLVLGRALDGCRGYMAVAGGIGVQPLLGSRATSLPGRFGGLQGRRLKAGDELFVGDSQRFHAGRVSVIRDNGPLRVVAGPNLGAFTGSALINLFCACFVVGANLDRTGVRLMGPPLRTRGQASLPSQGVLPGTIQVPPDGQPVILGWDGPVTGGYPVIAGVISADLGRVAQLQSGDRVSFIALDPDEARQAWKDKQSALNRSFSWLA